MNGQVEMIAGKRELANVFVHKLAYFGAPLHSGLVAGLCQISKCAQGRAEMIDLIEVHHAKPAGNGKEPSNAPKKHSDSLRHLAVGTGEPFTLVKVRAFARRESPSGGQCIVDDRASFESPSAAGNTPVLVNPAEAPFSHLLPSATFLRASEVC